MITVHNVNPIAPTTAPSADDILNAYQQHAAMIRGEAQQSTVPQGNGYNPYAPQQENQQDAQQAHAASIEQFLSPIAHNQYDIDSRHTEKRQKSFESRVEKDPAFKEFAPGLIQMAETLRQGVKAGHITLDDAKEMGKNWLNDNAKPVFEKHHSGKKWLDGKESK